MKRYAELNRTTTETDLHININLDGVGKAQVDTGIKFLDHMFTLMSKHGSLDINVSCKGDLEVDTHHTVEDIGIILGQAFNKALGDKKQICRYATTFTPMDEALTMISIDISGRSYLVYDVNLTREFVGDFETEMLKEFFIAFSNNANLTLHVKNMYGLNNHHIIESIFKGLGRTIRQAIKIDETIQGIPSTKGIL